MGTAFALLFGLPTVAMCWIGAAWVVTFLWSKVKLNLALAKQADEIAPHIVARAQESARRGY